MEFGLLPMGSGFCYVRDMIAVYVLVPAKWFGPCSPGVSIGYVRKGFDLTTLAAESGAIKAAQ
jgi:hypothetical protein